LKGEPRDHAIDPLSSVYEITARIVQSLDLDETLAAIAKAMTEVLSADIGAIYLVDEPAGVMRLRGIHGQRSPAWEGHVMPLDRGMNAAAFRTGKVQRIDDYATLSPDAAAQTAVTTDEPMRSVISAPMTHRGRRLGSMGAVRRRVRPFSDHEVELLETLADHASIAVANAIAYEELANAHARLAQAQGLGMRILLEVSRHLRADSDMHIFFGRVSRTVAELVGAERAIFSSYDREKQTLTAQRDAFGFPNDVVESLRANIDPNGDRLAERILFHDAIMRGNMGDDDPELAPYGADLAAMGVSNGIAVAWRVGDEPLGILGVYDSTRAEGFAEEDILVLQTAALAAGIVCQQRNAEERLAEQQARETAQLREHAERMAALEKSKSEFLQLASHELRSPIGVVRGYLSMLEDGSLGPGDLPRVLPILLAKTQQTNLLINEMLETARLESRAMAVDLRPVDLRDVVRQAVRIMQPLAGSASPIALSLPDGEVPVLADASRLETVVSNLLDNAVKYSPGKALVACTLWITDGHAEVVISDRGVGIAEGDLPRLFQRFSRIVTDSTRNIAGTGLGLYIARELARQQGGDITVESQVGEGSVFRLTLPIRATAGGSTGK
jgi:signal transduction histidine kinase/putative methionine-R-sulfoxide reductase with GAF domain